jgi:hypothetical protein
LISDEVCPLKNIIGALRGLKSISSTGNCVRTSLHCRIFVDQLDRRKAEGMEIQTRETVWSARELLTKIIPPGTTL